MNDWLQEAIKTGKDRWHTITGLSVTLIAVAAFLVVTFAGLELSDVKLPEWLVIVGILVIVFIFWWRTHIPRIPKGKVGVAIAIELEETDGANQLRADFIETLRDLLSGSDSTHKFEFRELSNQAARQVNLMSEHGPFLRRANIHYLLYGRARQRQIDGESVHVIDIKGVVRHGHVSAETRTQFSQDFAQTLPNRLVVNVDGAMLGFEMAAKHMDATARYIIGTASALSNDFAYSEKLLLEAEKRLEAFVQNEEGANLSFLLDKVRLRLTQLYEVWTNRLSGQYVQSRDKNVLVEAERIAENLLRYQSGNIDAHLTLAICAFMLHRDLDRAVSEAMKCNAIDDGIWKYSIAFLHAYKGELQDAYDWYRRAFSSPLRNSTVPTQSEEFIQLVLNEEPEMHQLYYALGLINHRAKRDYTSSIQDFKKFLELADESTHAVQIAAAKKWIREMERR